LFFISPIILLFYIVIGIGIVLYSGFTTSHARADIPAMINSDSAVLNAEIIYNEGVYDAEFYIRILFVDGNSLEVRGVNQRGKGEMEIEKVNDYRIMIVNRNGVSIRAEQELELWSTITGLQFKTIMDIVKNYDVFCKCIESWPDLSDYRQDNEKNYEVKNRMLRYFSLNNKITFDKQEYFFFKISDLR